MKDVAPADQAQPRAARDESIARHARELERFCPRGWQITQSSESEDGRYIMLAGRCTEEP
jgi:hypothetical protein